MHRHHRLARSARGWRRPTTTVVALPRAASSSAPGRRPSGSACSRTSCTSDPKVAPAGRSSIGDGRSSNVGPVASGVGLVTTMSAVSSTVPATSGSLSAGEASCSSARISPEYDVRRQVVSTLRLKGRMASGPGTGIVRAWTRRPAPTSRRSARPAPASWELGHHVDLRRSTGDGVRHDGLARIATEEQSASCRRGRRTSSARAR